MTSFTESLEFVGLVEHFPLSGGPALYQHVIT